MFLIREICSLCEGKGFIRVGGLKTYMSRILVVAAKNGALKEFTDFLKLQKGLEVLEAASAEEALTILDRQVVQTVVVDETLADASGLAFVRQVTKIQPLINCALVSALSAEDFHEATEGLGLFMQLPVAADCAAAEKMLQILDKIEVLLAS